jgi:phenylpropionate dioxygenase-like ring-hydroxylating dioxygenase large terminal subunit
MESEFQYLSAIVPNEYYHDAAIFEKEKVALFQNSWIFIGMSMNLENHNDFLTDEIGGVSVVVQNFRGTLRAFHNVCTHRFNKIQNAKQGNRALICEYHGWNYNTDGIPFGIPLKAEFKGLDESTLKKLCLKSFQVDTCGKFVFVNIDNNTQSLSDFLGDSKARLLQISQMIGRKIEYNEVPNAANWKVVIENTLEGYHISTVHPNTFYKLGFNLKSQMQCEIHGPHTNMTIQTGDLTPNMQREKFHKMIAKRPFQPDGFFHQLIFPNLSIGSAWGVTVYIGSIKALSPTESVFTYELYETNLGEGVLLNESISSMVNFSATEFTHTTLKEDRAICENVQRGIMQTPEHKGILNSIELRIWEFQKAYSKLMNIEL